MGDHTPEQPHCFEFYLDVMELTGDLALFITDCAEHENREDAIQLWDAHITDLRDCWAHSSLFKKLM